MVVGFGLLCEVFVDGGGGFAAFGDGPDHERLAAAHVAGGEDAVDARSCKSVVATLPRLSSARPSCSIMPLRTGPRKPMASRTRSTSRVNSVPAMGSNLGGGPTRTA